MAVLTTGPARLVSDLHLQGGDDPVRQRFFTFLNQCATAEIDALFILGDLFEAWIGDDALDDSPARDVAAALRHLANRGVRVFFMGGNRDFLVGKNFADAAGMCLIDDPTAACIAGHHVLLMHGDTLCTDDVGYMAFRQQVRETAWQRTFLARPLAERSAEAARMREGSRQAQAVKPDDIMDVNAEAVAATLARHHANVLIHGHTHRPAHHTLNTPQGTANRWVLSDWTNTRADALAINDQGFERISLV